MTAVIPAALWTVRLSLSDSTAGCSAGMRVAAGCRQLAEDEWGDQELWRIAADLFEMSSVERGNADQILSHARAIEREDEAKTGLGTLSYVLATWHANLNTAIHCQLGCLDVLLRWYSSTESTHRLILVPYVQSYWQRAIRECRFAFRAPELTVAAIEAALTVPEARRVHAILYAAAAGFRIEGLGDVLRKLREALSDATPAV